MSSSGSSVSSSGVISSASSSPSGSSSSTASSPLPSETASSVTASFVTSSAFSPVSASETVSFSSTGVMSVLSLRAPVSILLFALLYISSKELSLSFLISARSSSILISFLSDIVSLPLQKVSSLFFYFAFISERCLEISYISMPAATEALREVIFPFMGRDTIKSHFSFTSLPIPFPSEPITSPTGPL